MEELCNEEDPFEAGIKWAVHYLHQAHQTGLDTRNFDPQAFQDAINKFLLQYKALEDEENRLWLVKPKFHLFWELGQVKDCPAMNWNYRDEEAGGTLARMARSRGGLQTPWSVSSRCLKRFCCDFEVPFL